MNTLLVCIGLAPFLQPTVERFEAAFVFSFFIILHEMCFSSMDGLAYYGSAGLFDLMAITVLASMAYTDLGLGLQLISLASLAGNAVGWVQWTTYMPHEGYNSFFSMVYASAVLLLVTGGPNAIYRFGASCWNFTFPLLGRAGSYSHSAQYGKEATRWKP